MNPLFFRKNGEVIDYYRIFNLKPGYSPEILRSKFCELIKKCHPDSSGKIIPKQSEIISLIVNGYRVLSDSDLKREYDNLLIDDKLKEYSFIIPVSRIKYSFSLSEVIKSKTKNKKINHKYLLKKFGQDVEIFINKAESIKGARAYIELPSRTICPVCSGMDNSCYLCNGLGRINSISVLEIVIPQGIKKAEKYMFDLTGMKPDSATNFTMRTISVKIILLTT
ncbi:MAG: DnaJ domain-containing protein [Spirochaetes bacterium]|nr:DnaJ domain-containing protein [Spirochaetota bacterium]